MSALIRYCQRAALWFVIRSLEAQLQGYDDLLRECMNVEEWMGLAVRQFHLRQELVETVGRYKALSMRS